MDMDTFFVSVERLHNSGLMGKPVIIGGSSDRGVVAACSYEARQFGVHSAMPMRLARQLCPQAEYVRGDYDSYSKYSQIVTGILTEKAPCVEKASIDEHYLDLTGMDKFFGCMKWAAELREKVISETGLPISFGLSVNKTVSKVATGQAKPNGKINVSYGTEKAFLAPLSIKKIPMIGDKTYILLRNMGLEKIKTIQEMPVELMHSTLGENGAAIWRKANAIDNTPVVPHREQKTMSKEQTFDRDTTDMVLLRREVAAMVDALSFDLRKDGKLTACITLKIRYSNFDTDTKQARVPYTASNATLTEKALELFKKLYSRRMMIRLVGVKFSDLIFGSQQIDLFTDTLRDVNLNCAMDAIRKRFGYEMVGKAITYAPAKERGAKEKVGKRAVSEEKGGDRLQRLKAGEIAPVYF
jgi:DNA polymerase-4